MRQNSEGEAPPIASMDTTDIWSFVVVWTLIGVFLVLALMTTPGIDDVLLFCFGVWGAVYYWPKIPTIVREWVEMRNFKKSIPDGMKIKDEK